MKKGISLFSLMLLMFVATHSFAQVQFGLKGGLNLANMLEKDDAGTNNDLKMKPGFHLGVTAEFGISEKFAFETGLLFSTKGAKQDIDGGGTTVTFKYNVNNLEIPLNAVYKLDLGSAKLLINAGPYVGFAISGKVKASEAVLGDNGDSKEQKIEIGSDVEKDEIKPLDFGLNFGAGVQIKNITIGLQYGLGLANISTYTDNGTVTKNKVIGISLGYKFGGE